MSWPDIKIKCRPLFDYKLTGETDQEEVPGVIQGHSS